MRHLKPYAQHFKDLALEKHSIFTPNTIEKDKEKDDDDDDKENDDREDNKKEVTT